MSINDFPIDYNFVEDIISLWGSLYLQGMNLPLKSINIILDNINMLDRETS